MTDTTTPTAAQQAGAILHGLLSQFGMDLLASGTGILQTSLTSLKATPTIENAAAQGAAITLAAPLVIPTLEGEAISQFATAGLQLLALVPTAAPAPAAAS
jgi:hypothetical protein